MARKSTTSATQVADQAVAIAEYAAKALAVATQLRIKTKAVEQFPLDEIERASVAGLATLPAKLNKKRTKKNASFTVAETASIVMAVADSLLEGDPRQQLALLFIAKKLIDCLEHNIVERNLPTKARETKPTDALYQFKITLLGAKPAIWRRIQVPDCTLDRLHEYIQTAMGWTNSHLHHFRIGEQLYGDPLLMQENMEELGYEDSTTTLVSEIIPTSGKRFRFIYEYDFGDGWEHEVLCEGCPKAEADRKYPLCLQGKRACPPEDCGGVWGYADFLEAIRNKNHEQHEDMLEWIGGQFDPEEFDASVATRCMRQGLPNWR